MSQEFQIHGDLRRGVPFLEVDYPASLISHPQSSRPLGEELKSAYRDLLTKHTDGVRRGACVISIKPKVVSTALARAIFQLYKVVSADNATLYCTNYPDRYMDTLTALGMLALPGFFLKRTVDEALDDVAPAGR
jgi:hypothetical protein